MLALCIFLVTFCPYNFATFIRWASVPKCVFGRARQSKVTILWLVCSSLCFGDVHSPKRKEEHAKQRATQSIHIERARTRQSSARCRWSRLVGNESSWVQFGGKEMHEVRKEQTKLHAVTSHCTQIGVRCTLGDIGQPGSCLLSRENGYCRT